MDCATACDVVRAEMFSATDAEKLRLYALYKRAQGEALPASNTPRHGGSLVEAAKAQARSAVAHMSTGEAADEYARVVEEKLRATTL